MAEVLQVKKKNARSTMLVIISLIFLPIALGIEENQQEIFLSPRNFNPHPYVASFDSREPVGANRVGPVVFPPSPPEDTPSNNNIVTLQRDRKLNHPIDDHPYAKVAQKYKQQFGSRYRNNDINPRVYEALSSHAAKVLSEPPSQLGKDYTLSSLSDQKKSYAFSYKVVDHLTGDDFSHIQSQNSRATNGEYRVKLPDGRVQIVSYIADKNGYKADVKYTENDLSSENIQIQHIPAPDRNQIRPIPILKANSYDYRHQYDDISGSHLPTQLPPSYQSTPSPLLYTPKDYEDNGEYLTPTPRPNLLHYDGINHQPKVEIYTSNSRINRLGGYVATTVAPFLYDDGNVVSSTLSPTLQEDYSQVYVNTPKFGIVQNQQHGGLVYRK